MKNPSNSAAISHPALADLHTLHGTAQVLLAGSPRTVFVSLRHKF